MTTRQRIEQLLRPYFNKEEWSRKVVNGTLVDELIQAAREGDDEEVRSELPEE